MKPTMTFQDNRKRVIRGCRDDGQSDLAADIQPAVFSQQLKQERTKSMQGEFTKEEAQSVKEAVDEMFKALPKSKQMNFLGHLNDIFLFLGAAEREAPTEEEAKKKK
jgi:hypothetical protein